MTDREEHHNIWVNNWDGSVIFKTSPTQSDHPVHKYGSIPEAILDLEGIIDALHSLKPLEDQPENYGTLVADSINNGFLKQHFSKERSVLIKRERSYPEVSVFREYDETESPITAGPRMPSVVRFKEEFLELVKDFPQQDTEYLLMTINVVNPVNNEGSINQTTDIKERNQ